MRYVVLGLSFLIIAVCLWLLLGSNREPSPRSESAAEGIRFEDVAVSAGVRFHHFDPATELHLMPETMGSGLGWIDYDADGWPDLFCVQDGPLPPANDPTRTHALFRNNRDGTFADVTSAVGLNHSGFGVGCAVGDYNNDGYDDLVVSYLGDLRLFQNEPDAGAPGGRRFRDATARSGLSNPHWGTSCAWADLDGDALLDLYVCNYVEVDPAKPTTCRHPGKRLYYQCSPTAFPYTHHRLYRNLGNGVFQDVSEVSGISQVRTAPGLGVVIADLDEDGKPDIYVANDMNEAYLFRNLGRTRFEEVSLRSGTALGPGGHRIAGMGVAVADFDSSGRPSIFITNFQDSPNVLFFNRGRMLFDDASFRSGLGGPSITKLGFGTCTIDANLDGQPDLAIANGHVQRVAREVFGVQYAQPCQLFLRDGVGKFREAPAGSDFARPRVGRGLAAEDFDNDGHSDLALSGVGEQVALFRNRTASENNWLILHLEGDGKSSNRNAIGAVVRVTSAGTTQTHFLIGGGSYLSASDRRMVIGIGKSTRAERVSVRWPSGRTQEFPDLPSGTRWRLVEGQPPEK